MCIVTCKYFKLLCNIKKIVIMQVLIKFLLKIIKNMSSSVVSFTTAALCHNTFAKNKHNKNLMC